MMAYHVSRQVAPRQGDQLAAPGEQLVSSVDPLPYLPPSTAADTAGAYSTLPPSPDATITNLAAITSAMPTPSLPLITSAQPSASPTPSMTSITPTTTIAALPPAKKPGRRYRRVSGPFHPAYLAPVFAVVGVIVGAIFAFLVMCSVRKFRGSRTKPTTPGAQYSAASAMEAARGSNGGVPATFPGSESHFLGMTAPESVPTHLDDQVNRQQSWLKRALTAHRRGPARGRVDSVAHVMQHAEASFVGNEDDPFLVPPATFHVPGRPRSPMQNRDLERTRTVLERALRTPQSLEEDEELDNAPYETLRHKSRNILERLKHGSRYRRGHKRSDSDINIEDLRSSDEGSVLTSAFRSPSSSHGRGSSHVQRAKSPSPPGFRIIEEDTEADSRGEGSSSRGWSVPWAASPDKLRPSDTFTALPARVRSPDRRNSPRVKTLIQSPTSPVRARTPTFHLGRADSSMLPVSPPRVTSPPHETQLFFGPAPSFGSVPKLDLYFPVDHGKKRDLTPEARMEPSPDRKTGSKSRSQPPPQLPFSSASKFAQKGTPPRTPSPKKAAMPDRQSRLQRSRPRSDESVDSKTRTPAERFARRRDLLDKVDEILAQGWGSRELRGEELVISPTMFGAVPPMERPPAGGIEERLMQTTR